MKKINKRLAMKQLHRELSAAGIGRREGSAAASPSLFYPLCLGSKTHA